MALRDQPYLPLYIQDYLTDEKLNSCSAASQGVYIKIMCILHKQDEYGCVLLKQKDKQGGKQILNFASKFAKLLPFDFETILSALNELVDERVLIIDGDMISQKRMVKDFMISQKRSESGKKGGGNPNLFKQDIKQQFKQKDKQNTEDENENEIVTKKEKRKGVRGEKQVSPDVVEVIEYLNELNGTRFRTDTKSTNRHIEQRIKEGYSIQELREIVEYKVMNWKGTEWDKWLQPDTLFAADNCAKYRNQVQAAKDKGLTANQIKGGKVQKDAKTLSDESMALYKQRKNAGII